MHPLTHPPLLKADCYLSLSLLYMIELILFETVDIFENETISGPSYKALGINES